MGKLSSFDEEIELKSRTNNECKDLLTENIDKTNDLINSFDNNKFKLQDDNLIENDQINNCREINENEKLDDDDDDDDNGNNEDNDENNDENARLNNDDSELHKDDNEELNDDNQKLNGKEELKKLNNIKLNEDEDQNDLIDKDLNKELANHRQMNGRVLNDEQQQQPSNSEKPNLESELNNLNDHLLSNNNKLDAYLIQNEILTNSIKLFRSEFKRLGFNDKYWRYTSFNKNFTLCSTYPPYFIVPAQFVDKDLTEVAKFRHMCRLPAVVYRHRNAAVIVRSSQPSVGLLGTRRSVEDEELLKLIFLNCLQDQKELLEKSSTSLSSLLLNEDKQIDLDKFNKFTNCDCSTTGCVNSNKLNGNCGQLNQETNNCQNEFNSDQESSFINNNKLTNNQENEKYSSCNCKCHLDPSFNNNCQPTQSSKFFSLSDKILENIMSYTSYTDNQTTSSNKKLLILDARSFTVAFLHRAIGGGSECSEYYPNCEVDFLYLANIHAVRTAFFSLKSLIRPENIRTENNPYYFTNWSKSNSNYWLYYISNLIESSIKVVQAIDRDARPVLVHCSDGWDRTAQIISLAELMLDPFYRTIQGFKVLVQREWLDFGHKFADRCGISPVSKNVNERSPIFIQWLDCVYQIVRQCPDYFEFNCSYLEELALHTYSPLFGTFSCNSYLERFINQIHGETTSVWNYLEKSRDKFVNENYIETSKVLVPSYLINDMCIWRELYTKLITEEFESRFDISNATHLNSNSSKNQLDINNLRKKKLFRTNSFTTNNLCQQQTKNTIPITNLRKVKSDSDLLSSLQRSKNLSNDELPALNKFFQQLRNVNFRYTDQRLDPQPINGLSEQINLNGKTTCKFESKANGFLNCDSDKLIQYQVPLSVLTKIARIANNNPDSSLMYSILTYVNTLHTFSVK